LAQVIAEKLGSFQQNLVEDNLVVLSVVDKILNISLKVGRDKVDQLNDVRAVIL